MLKDRDCRKISLTCSCQCRGIEIEIGVGLGVVAVAALAAVVVVAVVLRSHMASYCFLPHADGAAESFFGPPIHTYGFVD